MTVTAAQAIANFKNNPHGPPQAVADSAANVGALLDGLQPLAAAGALQSIDFTDASPPLLSLTAAQLTNDAGVIARFYYNQNRYVYVSAVAANGIPVGNDSTGSGSASSPFASIARAEAGLLPGQTILLNGLAANPTAYVASTLSVANTGIDSVQAYGATIVASGSNSSVLYISPSTGGTITLGRVIVDGRNSVATGVALTTVPTGPYSAVFSGTHIQNFTSFGVLAEATNVSASFSGASLTSQDGVTAAIYFVQMASGALDVEGTTFDVKQALTGYGAAVTAYATSAGPSVKINNSNILVTSVVGTTGPSFHYGIRLINVHGAVIDNNTVTVDATASPTWGAKPISISATLDSTALDSGGFVIANNIVYGATSASMIGIQIGEEGDQIATRGLLDGGIVSGNSVSSSVAAQLGGAHGIFVGSEADTLVFGNTVTGVGIGIVDKNGSHAVYYANTVSNCVLGDVLLKGSDDASVLNNNLFTESGAYNSYAITVITNSVTGDATTGSVISGNTVVSTASSSPHLVRVDSGQGVAVYDNAYFATAPLYPASWTWQGQGEGSYAAWQSASGELGGTYTQGTSGGGTLNPYPVPVGAPPALTPSQKLSPFGLKVTAVTAANAPGVAATAGVIAVAVLDSAANVASDLNTLEAVASAGELTSVAFTDTSTPTLTLDPGTLVNDAAVVGAIVGPYDLVVAGGMTALQALKLPAAIVGHLTSGLTVEDGTADITAFLDQLQALSAAGHLAAIDLTGPGGSILALGAAQLSLDAGALSRIQGTHDLLLAGSIDNPGVITLAGAGPTGLMVAAAGVTLTGGGTLSLGATGTDSMLGVSLAATLTNVDNTISGAGGIGAFQLTLINEAAGVIDANAAAALTLATGRATTIVNDGLIEATGAGGLVIASCCVNDTGGGVIDAAGGAVDLRGAAIIGGTLESSGAGRIHALAGVNTFDGTQGGLNNQATVIVDNGAALTLEGAIDNVGSLSLAGSGSLTSLFIGAAGVTLSGHGKLYLGAGANDRVIGFTATAILTNLDNLIYGAGALGGRRMTLVNEAAGVIEAASTALTIDTASNTIANAGKIACTGSGALTIDSAIANSGILEVTGGSFIVNGAVSGAGRAVIYGGVLDFTSTFSQLVAFASAGVLELGRSQSYAGTVAGFSKTGATSLDLRDIAFVSAGEASYSGTTAQAC